MDAVKSRINDINQNISCKAPVRIYLYPKNLAFSQADKNKRLNAKSIFGIIRFCGLITAIFLAIEASFFIQTDYI